MSNQPQSLAYRPDIDGLRALAVLAVVLTHARLMPTTGGVAGVDIFFVISGFLITSILRDDFAQERWSVAGFYARRAWRLLPALVVVLVAANLIALSVYAAEQSVDIVEDSLWALGFSSNFHFLFVTSFFGRPDHHAILLHTWSLAVEEQFYILYPFLLLALLRRSRDRLTLAVLAGAAALSFGLAAWGVSAFPDFAYSMLPTRMWELLLGAILALPALPRLPSAAAPWASALGLLAILATPFVLVAGSGFPGPAALLPTVGTALVIHAGQTRADLPVSRLLATPPLRFVGRISYSLYLWHLPLLILAIQSLGRFPGVAMRLAMVAGFIGVSALSWRFIEMPFRRSRSAHLTASAAAPPIASRA